MTQQLLFVFSNAIEGKDDQYHEWYEDHVQHLADLDGFISGQRFELNRGMGPDEPPFKYVVIYEVEGDGSAARNSMRSGLKDGSIIRDPAVNWESMQGWFYRPMSEKKAKRSAG